MDSTLSSAPYTIYSILLFSFYMTDKTDAVLKFDCKEWWIMIYGITGSQAGQSGKEKNIFAAPHPTLSMRKKKYGSTSPKRHFLTYLLSFFHSSDFPVWPLPDFQLQRQKILLIIAGTFRRYSEISMLNHSAQREKTHSVRGPGSLLFRRLTVLFLCKAPCLIGFVLAKQAWNK